MTWVLRVTTSVLSPDVHNHRLRSLHLDFQSGDQRVLRIERPRTATSLCHKAPMDNFEYDAPAEVYSSGGSIARKRSVTYRRFRSK